VDEKKPKVVLACQDFLSAGGCNTYPDLILEGRVEAELPKDLRGKKLSADKKKEILQELVEEKARERGCSHVFYFGYNAALTLALGDAYRKSSGPEFIHMSLTERFKAKKEREKYDRDLKKYLGLDDL